MKKFRNLRADEIDCRVSQINENKSTCTLLLYKDARCDMNILDETVGPENWQREHTLIDGQLFCRVGIREVEENYVTAFVWKEDVGTESYTEAEKGRASDSFKRACVNWGIGRELYTAPKIEVPCHITVYRGKKTTFDKFKVESIGYDAMENINALVITHDGVKVYELKKPDEPNTPETQQDPPKKTDEERMADAYPPREEMVAFIKANYDADNLAKLLDYYKAAKVEDLTQEQLIVAYNRKAKK